MNFYFKTVLMFFCMFSFPFSIPFHSICRSFRNHTHAPTCSYTHARTYKTLKIKYIILPETKLITHFPSLCVCARALFICSCYCNGCIYSSPYSSCPPPSTPFYLFPFYRDEEIQMSIPIPCL